MRRTTRVSFKKECRTTVVLLQLVYYCFELLVFLVFSFFFGSAFASSHLHCAPGVLYTGVSMGHAHSYYYPHTSENRK